MTPAQACVEKRVYPTKQVAKHAARKLHSRGRSLARPYHCPACGEWHLTTADADARAAHRRGQGGTP